MPAQRAEGVRGSEDKATPGPEAPASPGGAARQSDGWKAWLPLGVAVVLMPLLAYLVTSLILVPRLRNALGTPGTIVASASPAKGASGASSRKADAPAGPQQTATLNKILVNVAGTMGSRYLLTSLTLEGNTPDFADLVAQKEAQLKDFAGGVLSTKTIADLERPGARNLIRGELLAGFNNILGSSAVQEIYFTEFAIQ